MLKYLHRLIVLILDRQLFNTPIINETQYNMVNDSSDGFCFHRFIICSNNVYGKHD